VDPQFQRAESIEDPERRLMSLALYPRPALFRFATAGTVARAARAYPGRRFDVVHVFRLYAAPLAEPYMDQSSCWLDLDDIESRVNGELAVLLEMAGQSAAASLARAESLKYEHAERAYLPRFSRVFVCSERDREFVERKYRVSGVRVVPNAVRVPAGPPARHDGGSTLLFVGVMGYLPNEDAMLYFCGDILPRIRSQEPTVKLTIVGSSPSELIGALAGQGVTITGRVAEVGGYYTNAVAAIVPLRAGGGTRIKILEALAHGCPVVSTSKGAEGLAVTDGKQMLLADSPDEFAAACLRVLRDAALRERLRSAAWEFVRTHHSLDAVDRGLSDQNTTP
jgi:glycosyltransferase involved in cell wall biosynthesis